MNEKIELLFEELNEEKEQQAQTKSQKSNFLGDIHIEGILFILFIIYLISKKNDKPLLKLEAFQSGDIYNKISKMNYLVNDISPYFGYNTRSMLVGIGSLLNAAENLYGINQGVHKEKAKAISKVSSPKQTIKMLETLAPYLEGTGRENVNKILSVNNKMDRIKNNKGGNLLQNGQDMIDMLDMLNVKKAKEIKNNINQIKAVMKLINN